MIKILRYLKPYVLSIFLVAGFLFLQANSELALPDYMSRIVNVGIQQGGVENALPLALEKEGLERLTSLMNPEDRTLALNAYESKDSLLHLKDLSSEEKLRLTIAFEQAYVKSLGLKELSPSEQKQRIVYNLRQDYSRLGLDEARIQRGYLMKIGGRMILLTLISAGAAILVGFFASRTSAGMARNLRQDLFSRVEHFSGPEFDRFSTASLITRSTNDVTQVQNVTNHALRLIFFAPIMGAGGIIRALEKAPSMAWLIGLAVLILMVLVLIVFTISMPKFQKIQDLVDRLNRVARENLSGLMVVRSFNSQDFETGRFDRANRDLTSTNLFVMRVMVIMMPAMMLIMNLLSLAIIRLGSEQIAASTLQVGDMMAFMQYSMQIVMAFLMMTMIFIFLPRAAVAARRINEVLETELSVTDPEDPLPLPENVEGRLVFEGVCFRYPGAEEDALKDISFTVEPGQTTALIGATGAGKSTLVQLIPRFYEVNAGRILLDGQDIRRLRQKDLRDSLGYVPQKTILFSGTVESNLLYADRYATEERILESTETAQAREFIQGKEERFQAPVSQGGTNLSGGQKQRLTIARALVKQPPLLIFDDSFSALDYRTESTLRRALREKSGNSGVILVSQRVASIQSADQIIVLEEGRIAGKGTHRDLLENCSAYREIALSQLDKKELA